MPASKAAAPRIPLKLDTDERWLLVQRIAASQTFAGSPQLRAFLLFVADHALSGHADEIKEQTIGARVLGRKADYDPGGDNIVRVRARQLRTRIEQYFRTEGTAEKLIVRIPKGGYVPVFEERPATVPVVDVSIPRPRRTFNYRLWLPWTVAGILAIACAVLIFQVRARGDAGIPGDRRLWAQVFPGHGADTLLVVGDSGLALWQDLTHKRVGLSDYIGMQFLGTDAAASPGLGEVARRRFTSLADVNLAMQFAPLSRALGSRIKLRLARNMDVHDLESGNAILLGSRRANPWVELFEPHLHYVWDYDDTARKSFFRARAEAHVEPEILTMNRANGGQESYALVAVLPNVNHTGRVLLVEGLSMEGTDAAGQFLLDPASSKDLVRRVVAQMGSVDQPFEALLRLTPVAGGSANISLLRLFRPLP